MGDATLVRGAGSYAADDPLDWGVALTRAQLEALFANPWFAGLSHELQRALLRSAVVWNVGAGQTLVRQGSLPDVWFGIAAGAVALWVTTPDGSELMLDLLEPGQWLGEMPLIAGTAVPYTTRIWASSTLLLMRRSALRQLLAAHPELAPALIGLSALRVRRLVERLAQQSTMRLEDRLHLLLVDLASRFGEPLPTGTRIRLPLTQTQLGALVGASRQRVNLTMQKLEQRGKLRRLGQLIELRGA